MRYNDRSSCLEVLLLTDQRHVTIINAHEGNNMLRIFSQATFKQRDRIERLTLTIFGAGMTYAAHIHEQNENKKQSPDNSTATNTIK